MKIYVCDVATLEGGTGRFTVGDHVAVLDAHIGPGVFPLVLANDNLKLARELPDEVEMVRPDPGGCSQTGACRLVTADLADRECPWRHDPARLSHTILDIYAAERSA